MVGNTISFCKTLTKVTRIIRKTPFQKGKLVTGNVTFKVNEFALMNIGFVQNAILVNNGSWNYENLTVGTVISVYIEYINNDEVIVSRRKLDEDELWGKLEKLCDNGTEIEVRIIEFTRKGIKLDVFGVFGIIFWTKKLINLEIELRNKLFLSTRIKAIWENHNMVALSLTREIENTMGRVVTPMVWVGVIALCDKGVWTHVDACNGIILLSGRPWCGTLSLINRLPFGEIILSRFVSLKKLPKPIRSGDYVDLLVNFVAEIEEALIWDWNISSINSYCVRKWITSLALANRGRWCDWRNRDQGITSNQFNFNQFSLIGNFINLNKSKFYNELNFDLFEVAKTQNLIWDKEQMELSELLCGFDYNRFKTIQNVLNLIYGNRLNLNDKTWCTRINNAWLREMEIVVTLKAQWRRKLELIERERIFKNLQNKVKHLAWREELEWEDEQNLINKMEAIKASIKEEEEIKTIFSWRQKPSAGERRKNEIKDMTSYLERLNRGSWDNQRNESNWNSLESKEKRGEDDQNEPKQPADIDRELDDEWNRKWYLEREQNYWDKQYAETECSLIETNCENWNDVRILRPVYAVIVGMDIQTMLLVAAITNKLLTYICDFSFTTSDVKMLQKDWKNSLAIKILPIALNYSLYDVLVEADTNGYKYLHFVTENIGLSLIGVIMKIAASDITIKVSAEVYGKLRFNVSTDDLGIKVGMEVDVMISDFNPITNDINLELTEDETIRTILVET
ncbi:MAG: hypothetical protein ACTS4V_00950 [Candidatus Hodgkinia cicadicola]